MPDASILDANRTLVEQWGAAGAVIVLLVAALAWVVRQWLKTQQLVYAQQEARISEAKAYASVLEESKTIQAANVQALQALQLTVQNLATARNR